MTDQEAVHEGKKPFKGRLGRKIARVAYITFYAVSLLLLLACVGAWIQSFQGTYYYSVDLYSAYRDRQGLVFSQRYMQFTLRDGEVIAQIGKGLRNKVPTQPWRSIEFNARHEKDPMVFEISLPDKGWHQFRYELEKSPGDRRLSLGESSATIAFPFWSAFVILLVPPLIWLVRRASRKVVENRRGFTPILKA